MSSWVGERITTLVLKVDLFGPWLNLVLKLIQIIPLYIGGGGVFLFCALFRIYL